MVNSNKILISPSLLSADFANLAHEVKKIEAAGADMIHIDVMDGNFVPNITIGFVVIKAIRAHTKLPFDVHLMIDQPERYIPEFADAGADLITIHPETTKHLDRTLELIKKAGAKAGVSLLPSTKPDIIDFVMDKIDLALVMSVNPGFGGQEFIKSQLSKIKILAQKFKASNQQIILAVDGGINSITSGQCIEAGANMLISGSYIFSFSDYAEPIKLLRNNAK